MIRKCVARMQRETGTTGEGNRTKKEGTAPLLTQSRSFCICKPHTTTIEEKKISKKDKNGAFTILLCMRMRKEDK